MALIRATSNLLVEAQLRISSVAVLIVRTIIVGHASRSAQAIEAKLAGGAGIFCRAHEKTTGGCLHAKPQLGLFVEVAGSSVSTVIAVLALVFFGIIRTAGGQQEQSTTETGG